MTIDMNELKRANPIQDVIAELTGYELKGQGQYREPRKGTKEGGLVINIDDQMYFWNSKNRGGDVVHFLEHEQGMTFIDACQWLARRAGLPLHLDPETAQRFAANRARIDKLTLVMRWLMGRLAESDAATAYAEGRGWDADLMQRAGCGFWGSERKAFTDFLALNDIDVDDPVAVMVLGFQGDVQAWADKWKVGRVSSRYIQNGSVPGLPHDSFVYGHWEGARCVYFSARGIHEKRHHNPPAELAGDRMPYWNYAAGHSKHTFVVVVEGQADALTLEGWNIPAVALAGAVASDAFVKQVGDNDRVYLALDQDDTGLANTGEIAERMGPTTRIVTWPTYTRDGELHQAKDVNEWAVNGGTGKQCRDILGTAPIFALWMCERASRASALEADGAMDAAVDQVSKLPEYVYEKAKKACADALGIGVRELNNMRRALQKTDDSVSKHRIEVTMPNGHLDGHLFEMIYQEDENGPRTAFAVRYPDGRLSISRSITTENYTVTPLPPMETIIQRGFIKLCSELGDYRDDVALQKEVQAFIHKYVDVPEHIEVMASYYVMMTWAFDKFYVLPYLRARGDSDSGKSRFTETVGYICMRPIMITGATTPSPVFRLMEKWNGLTVVMDEADLPHAETASDWTMMLNTGYKRESGILRTAISNGEAKVEAFSAFGPKVLNMRGKFPDDATESRCLTWETSSGRGIREDIPRYMDRDGFQQEALAIRNKLLRWRLATLQDVDPDYNHERTKHLPGRLVEITVSLMSISTNEHFRKQVMEFVEQMNQEAMMERQDTLQAKVLMGVMKAYYLPDDTILDLPATWHDQMKLSVSHITRQTNRVINDENAEASLQGSEEYESMKQMKAFQIGRYLTTNLNLKTERATVGTRSKILVWDEKRINALIARYGLEDYVMDLAMKATERAEHAEKQAGDTPISGGQGELKL